MKQTVANRNQAENEVVFRNFNEQMNKGIAHLKKVAEEEEQYNDIPNTKKAVHFYCECADEKCQKRVQISPDVYAKLHKKNNSFVIIPGHNVSAIERIILSKKNYQVVEKFVEPPEHVEKLHKTDLHLNKQKA